MTCESNLSCKSPKQHSLCAAWLHPAWTTEFVTANLWGEAQKYCATCLNSTHCSLCLQRKLATHTVLLRAWCIISWKTRGFSWSPKSHIMFINHTIQVEVCLIRKPNIVEWYLIILSPLSKCHSLTFVSNCKFRQHCHLVWTQIQIPFQYLSYRLSGYS
jgi:hypothetical protein